MDLDEMDPQTDSNIRFRAVIRGWSNNSQQARARTLLALSDDKMAKALRNKQDIILIPKHWWQDAKDKLEPEEPGWWYTVSDVICFQECRACKKRLGKDHQDATRCPKLETAHTFTPTRHIPQTIKRIWQVERIHGLPAIAAPTFFPTTSRNKDTWWEKRAGEATSMKTPRDK
jgi:hypothetical protein